MSIDVLGGLRAAVDALLALDPGVLGDGATLTALSVELSRVEALVCRESAVFDRRGEWAVVGAQNAAAWLLMRSRRGGRCRSCRCVGQGSCPEQADGGRVRR